MHLAREMITWIKAQGVARRHQADIRVLDFAAKTGSHAARLPRLETRGEIDALEGADLGKRALDMQVEGFLRTETANEPGRLPLGAFETDQPVGTIGLRRVGTHIGFEQIGGLEGKGMRRIGRHHSHARALKTNIGDGTAQVRGRKTQRRGGDGQLAEIDAAGDARIGAPAIKCHALRCIHHPFVERIGIGFGIQYRNAHTPPRRCDDGQVMELDIHAVRIAAHLIGLARHLIALLDHAVLLGLQHLLHLVCGIEPVAAPGCGRHDDQGNRSEQAYTMIALRRRQDIGGCDVRV